MQSKKGHNWRLGPLRSTTIYGVDGEHDTPYMTQITLGRLRLHIFYRGDADPDHHDHPWWFVTFPLTSYVEEVLEYDDHRDEWVLTERLVSAFLLHYRRATYRHRVLGRFNGRYAIMRRGSLRRHIPLTRPGRIVTIVWRGSGDRGWGFWKACAGEVGVRARQFMPWRRYVFEGGKHAPCLPLAGPTHDDRMDGNVE